MESSIDSFNVPVALRPRLWSTLPFDLIELIESKQDFSTMISSRLVCKSWYKMVTLPGFCPPNPAPRCVLLTHNSIDNLITVHNSDAHLFHTWHYNPLAECTIKITEPESAAYLEHTCVGIHSLRLDHIGRAGGLDLIGTAGGLLCFRTSRFPNQIVSNPISKTFRVLPRMVSNSEILNYRAGYRVWWALAVMLFDQVTGGYKLVMVGYCDAELYPVDVNEYSRLATLEATQVYDSLANKWTLTNQRRKINGGSMSFDRSCNKSVLYKGFLFVITLAKGHWHGGLSVMIFSLDEGTWVEQFLGSITDDWGPAYGSIAVSNNELYMAATDHNYSWSTINYWKLNVADLQSEWRNGSLDQEAYSAWQLVRRISNQSPQFQFPVANQSWGDTRHWFSMGHNGCFYFLLIIHDTEDRDTVVVHHMAADTWTTLEFEGPSGLEDAEFSCMCMFEPSFALA